MEQRISYEEFCQLLLQKVREHYPPECVVEIHQVVKNNGVCLDSLIIRREEQGISPNFYLNQFYEKYLQDESITEIVEEIVQLYEYSMRECENMELDFTYENCKERIVLRLASGVWNKKILDKVPHIPFLDMVILFYVVLRVDEDGVGSVRISNQLQEEWHISTRSLFTLALGNSKQLFPEKIGSLVNVLQERVSIGNEQPFQSYVEGEYSTEEQNMPFVITNNYGINGATAILYPNILKQLGERFGCSYYLIPSSIHEFLAIPSSLELSVEEMEYMVKEVNRTCVTREEMLSETVYYYNIPSDRISVVQG